MGVLRTLNTVVPGTDPELGSSPTDSAAAESSVLRGGFMQAAQPHEYEDFVTADLLRAAVQADAPHLRMREVLGEGGMAVVFAAIHQPLELAVAVKVLRAIGPHRDEMAARLLNEGKLCAMLSEVGAPRVLDARMLRDGTPYVVMERIAGTLLSDMLDPGPIDPALALEIADGLLTALSSVHAARVVHRDVKPANIILEPRQYGGFRVRLIDFGVATLMDAQPGPYGVGETNATQTGAVVGTPDYVAPEQLLGLKADGRADVYAAAATLFHMLTGKPPFQRTHLHLAIAATLRDPLPRLTDLCPHLPHTLESVLSAALCRDVNARTPSAEALQYALRNVFATAAEPARGAYVGGHTPTALPRAAASLVPHAVPVAPARPVTQTRPVTQARPVAQPAVTAAPARVESLPVEASGARRTLTLSEDDAPTTRGDAPTRPSQRYEVPNAAQRGLKMNFDEDGDVDEMALIFPRRRGGLAAAVFTGLFLASAAALVWVERVHPERLPPRVAAAVSRVRVGAEQLALRVGVDIGAGHASTAEANPNAPRVAQEPVAPPAQEVLPGAPAAAEQPIPSGESAVAALGTELANEAAPAGDAPAAGASASAEPDQVAAAETAPAAGSPADSASAREPAQGVATAPVPQISAPTVGAPSKTPGAPAGPPVAAATPEPVTRRRALQGRRPHAGGGASAVPDAPLVGDGFALSPVLEGIDSQLRGTATPATPPEPRGAASPLVDNPY